MIRINKKSLFALVGALFVTSLLFTQSAFAAGPSNNTKPGWGHGDKNHVHTGPPGHSVSVHPGDGDHDGDDLGDVNKRFHNLLSAWFKFFQNHHWIGQGHNS